MATRTNRPSARPQMERREIQKIEKFLRELGWLLTEYKDVNFRRIPDFVVRRGDDYLAVDVKTLHRFASSNTNKQLLVGILPRMFTDDKLFPNNEDIADFALNVLGTRIPRWQKKSRYELIGHVLCVTAQADDEKLAKVAGALSSRVADETRYKNIMMAGRLQQKSWKEIIQQLIDEGNTD